MSPRSLKSQYSTHGNFINEDEIEDIIKDDKSISSSGANGENNKNGSKEQ